MEPNFKYFLRANPFSHLINMGVMGSHNGYVVIPPDHPLVRLVRANKHEMDQTVDVDTLLSGYLICHREITFFDACDDLIGADSWKEVDESDMGYYVIGFDTAHGGDGNEWDFETVKSETIILKEQLENLYKNGIKNEVST